MVFSLLLGAWLFAQDLAARDLKPLVPEGALAVVEVPDAERLFAGWDGSPLARFWADGGAAKFFRPTRRGLERIRKDWLDPYGLTPEAMRRAMKGGAVLAFTGDPNKDFEDLDWVLIFEHGDSPELRAAFGRQPAVAGTKVEVSHLQAAGLNYTRTRLIREIPAKISDKQGLTAIEGVQQAQAPAVKRQLVRQYDVYFGDDMAVVAQGKGGNLEAILPKLAQQTSGAADAPQSATAAALRSLPPDSSLKLYVALNRLAKAAEGAKGGRNPMEFNPAGLHLSDFADGALGVQFKKDRIALTAKIRSGPVRRGVAQGLFLASGTPPEIAADLPSSATMVSTSNLPLDQVWDLLWPTLAEAAPAVCALFQGQVAAMETATGINVRQQILSRLAGGVGWFENPNPSQDHPWRTVTWIAPTREPGELEAAIRAVLQYGAQTFSAYHFEKVQLGAWPLYEIYLGQAQNQYKGEPAFYLCFADSWLLASAEPSGIRTWIDFRAGRAGRPSGGSLAKQADYRRAMDWSAVPYVGRWFGAAGQWPRMLNVLADWAGSKNSKKSNGMMPNLDAIPPSATWKNYFGPASANRTIDGNTMDFECAIFYP